MAVFALIDSIPMSTCFELGYKFTSILRILVGKTLVHTVTLLDFVPVDDIADAVPI